MSSSDPGRRGEAASAAGTLGLSGSELLAQCFWTYPLSGDVLPGQPLTFQVFVPPALPAAGTLAGYPLTGSVVSWSLTGADKKPLAPGTDYLVLEGDLQSALLSVVFNPKLGSVSVGPRLSLFTAPAGTVASSTWDAVPYTLTAPDNAVVERIRTILAAALSVTAAKSIIEPCEPALLQVVPRSPGNVPQVVTSIAHDAPGVEIRGAIPLDPLVEAVMGPITGALGRVLPGNKVTLEKGGNAVRRILSEPLAIPIAIDVLGKRLTTATAPVGVPEMAVLTSTPADGGTFQGLVPIGRWQSPFTIASATWTVTTSDGGAAQSLSPGLPFQVAYLLKPAVVALSRSDTALANPATVTVTATVTARLTDAVVGSDIVVALPPVTLQRLPLALPQLAAVFRHSMADIERADEQWVYLTTDAETAAFIPTRDDVTRLVTRLGSVLSNVVAVANTLGSGWDDLVALGSAVSLLAFSLSRLSDSSIYFTPVWEKDGKLTLKGMFDDEISAVIRIGPAGGTYFKLSDDNGSEYITFGYAPASPLSCILPTLVGRFKDLQQIPPESARASDPDYDYNDKMEVLSFPTI